MPGHEKNPRAISIVALLLVACGQPDAPASDSAATLNGALGRYQMTRQTMQQWKLPGKLREISGLALTGDGRLLAIADEYAIVYELDYVDGRIVKTFALGEPTVKGDFEGIAVIGETVFLTTSDGTIYSSLEADDGKRAEFEKFKTGLGKHCEIEGLTALGGNLLILCKKTRSRKLIDGLSIFVWSGETAKLLMSDLIGLPESEILSQLDLDHLSPSGLAVDAETGHLLLVAAQQRALVEITTTGKLVEAIRMPLADRHRQAEGIEITGEQELLISDEGGHGKARVAIYQPAVAGDQEFE